MKWLFIISIILSAEAIAEESILYDNKSMVNMVNQASSSNQSSDSTATTVKANNAMSEKFIALYKNILASKSYKNKGKHLAIANSMIKNAKQYESGLKSKDEFDSQMRDDLASLESISDSAETQSNSNSVFKSIGETLNSNNKQQNSRDTINCITNQIGDTTYTNCR